MPFVTWTQRASRFVAVPLLAYAAVVGSGPAAAEIFRCVAKDGAPLYQNFPCHLDSLDFASSSPAVTPLRPVLNTTSENTAAETAKGVLPVRNRAGTAPAAAIGSAALGMTGDEVRARLGEPAEIVHDELRKGRVFTWRYANGSVVQFDNKHRVVELEE
jgi:hypothetical protein